MLEMQQKQGSALVADPCLPSNPQTRACASLPKPQPQVDELQQMVMVSPRSRQNGRSSDCAGAAAEAHLLPCFDR